VPYEGEFAQFRSVRRLVDSDHIKSLLGNFHLAEPTGSIESLQPLNAELVSSDGTTPRWIVAVDGSHLEVQVTNGYPQAEASYITVASVLIDVEKLELLDASRPVDPQEFRKTEQAESIDCALPGANVFFSGEDSSRDSLRRSLLEVLAQHRVSAESESLLDTYEALLQYKPKTRNQKCPYDDCPSGYSTYEPEPGEYLCPCERRRTLYSTDALRIHEGMNLEGTNGALFAEVMQVWERIWIIHLLRFLEQKGWLNVLCHVAIVLDEPLGVFGYPAWLSKSISAELIRLNRKIQIATGGRDLLLLGVEKTGQFVQHFYDLDQGLLHSGVALKNRTLLLLDDIYIKQHIVFSQSEKPYGQDTYFGRKFLYKTQSGALIVASVPFLREGDSDVSRADPSLFPRIEDAIVLIDRFVSSRFPNALSPLISAHAEAAIPLNLGKRVLEKLAKELILSEAG
jgi:hypothetical protein